VGDNCVLSDEEFDSLFADFRNIRQPAAPSMRDAPSSSTPSASAGNEKKRKRNDAQQLWVKGRRNRVVKERGHACEPLLFRGSVQLRSEVRLSPAPVSPVDNSNSAWADFVWEDSFWPVSLCMAHTVFVAPVHDAVYLLVRVFAATECLSF
jgi:hypothetical protein